MVLIFSPQKWSHQFISKHHYAIAFSEKNKTLFFEPIICKLGRFKINILNPVKENQNLNVIQIIVPWPGFVRFHAKVFFRKINTYIILNIVKRYSERSTILIDFGYYQAISNWSFIACNKKIFFPVDDYQNLPIEKRDCNTFYTVSKNIQTKFRNSEINMEFMPHGISKSFTDIAEIRLKQIKSEGFKTSNTHLNIGYSGNLTIPFLNRDFILKLVLKYADYEFHFFGNYESNDIQYQEWLSRLKKNPNVHLYGQLPVHNLSKHLFKMDLMLLCYKLSHQNIKAENSHKINEYLSTGMPLLSTSISVLEGTNLAYPIEFENDEITDESLNSAIKELTNQNKDLMIERINYALQFRYNLLIQKL